MTDPQKNLPATEQPKVISEQVDIYQYPTRIQTTFHGRLVLGDLHGNAMKLIFFLVTTGILELSPQDYNTLVSLYKMDTDDLTAENLSTFENILTQAKCHNEIAGLLRLVGDEVADRGKNDAFTKLVLDRLKKGEVSYKILPSNHGDEFVQAYEQGGNFEPRLLDPEFVRSMLGLNKLIEKGLVNREKFLADLERMYKPHLCLLDCDLSQDGREIIVYTHAVQGLEGIEALAKACNLPYEGSSARALANTIDKINAHFQTFVMSNIAHTLFDRTVMKHYYDERYSHLTRDPAYRETKPFESLIWNRYPDGVKRPVTLEDGSSISFAHGHDGTERSSRNIFNLDYNNNLGKLDHLNRGTLNYLTVPARFAPALHSKHSLKSSSRNALPKYPISQLLLSIKALTTYGEKLQKKSDPDAKKAGDDITVLA